jgi:spermidine/putrescine transport system permease protein
MAFLHAVSSGHSATKNVLKGRSLTPYLLLAPGLIWLITFFIIPIFSLASTSTMVRPDGAQVGVYEQKLRFANYVDAFVANQDQYLRSFF